MEDDNKFPATGALFTAKSKRTEKSPDYSGSLEFEMDVVNDLIAQKNEGIEIPKVNLVGWKKVGRTTQKPYLRIIANIEKDRRDGITEVKETKKEEPKDDDSFDDPIPF
jgi:hypothetical protein|tara:strand:+ start:1013 stop:1339 length:327 start_codon:yes stop_codon:yes gene_type:complete